ncbi:MULTISPECIES: hypothetical protein [Providencia]|uniref:Lipoprotein n=2 Tax=Providencia heimbachae TaxID=333962 RepID=A0A1B7K0P3_9GAMM|nr:hypothetical protein [Providencia heimbachae]MBP6120764.1 hypothetical protein [Providencia sp.]NIH23223.1 hypothetical protein [Providencia heimbachae]OAT53564.1 hypothetical protein M998_0813 [Providencia heimbachae ATCC 35613]SQH13873.1 Uncharacterised protein [Providencia heimbachae]
MNKLLACFLSVSILSSTGCITKSVWEDNPTVETKSQNVVKLTDKIVTTFEYKNIKIQGKTTKKDTDDANIPNSGFGFAGEKYAYLLTSGSTELMELNEIVKKIPLAAFDNQEGIIRIKILPNSNSQSPIEFMQDYFVYTDSNYKLTKEQIKILEQAGFKKKSEGNSKSSWIKTVPIKGYVIDRNDMNLPAISGDKLNELYTVELYSAEDKKSFSTGNLAAKIIATPFTIVADVIVMPPAAIFVMYAFSKHKPQ